MNIRLPPVYSIAIHRPDYDLRQLAAPSMSIDASVVPYTGTRRGLVLITGATDDDRILVVKTKSDPPHTFSRVLNLDGELDATAPPADYSSARWHKHPDILSSYSVGALQARLRSVLESWRGAFSFKAEDADRGITGLRIPQIGAVHASTAHWSVTTETATIVMPTGTGKTETMLSLLVATPCDKLLVVVPTDALRTQIADKFLSLGILKASGVVNEDAKYPIVATLKKKPKTEQEVDDLCSSSNVIVTTSHIAGQSATKLQERFAHHCTHLFIDEAHHVEANTWKALKRVFATRPILQFTATPFREDGKILEGKIIYKYPLRKAQQEGFFRPIHFRAVEEFDVNTADQAIANAAIAELRADVTHKHILMARVGSINRAEKIFELYSPYIEFSPVQLHSGLTSKEKQNGREKLLTGSSRIVVCVDMLGEGFDLPELKIAAFHDIRKSLAVTLQIAGRFTRARPDLGDPIFIANVGDVDVRDELRKLYAQDPDWNALLPELSEIAIGEQVELKDYLEGFGTLPEGVPLLALRPATSTVVYRTKCQNWNPHNFLEGLGQIEAYAAVRHSLNTAENTLVLVTAQRAFLNWAEVEDLFTWEWELFVLIWDADRNLLYIHNSSNKGMFRRLAEAVAGPDVELIKEPTIYRCFAGINRLRLTNVGLREQVARLVSYTARMGADVEQALSDATKQNTRKAVLFGTGFENGSLVTMGASRRGRIWSFERVRLNVLRDWCRSVGAKLIDESIDPEAVLKGTLPTTAVNSRPEIVPIGIDWPDEFYKETEYAFSFLVNDTSWPLYETSIEVVGSAITDDLKFRLAHNAETTSFALQFVEDAGFRITSLGSHNIMIGRRSAYRPLTDYFYENPPVFWFADGSMLEGNLLTRLRHDYPPYDQNKIQVLDWAGVNIKKEAQGITKQHDSIQFKIIQTLLNKPYDVIFDDDGSGEIADVVAIQSTKDGEIGVIQIDLYHCKYSTGGAPGARVEDLYELCGQAQKSTAWARSNKQVDLFNHLLRRDPKRSGSASVTRFEKGNKKVLSRLREMSRVSSARMRIFAVQPGLSKTQATTSQLALLAVTENYLLETSKVPFTIIASD